MSRAVTTPDPAHPERGSTPSPGGSPARGEFLGHPRGLLPLSGLEVWERFSFLGMQAILVLYFADTVAHGGLAMAPATAASVTAAYGTLVYLVSVAGGWLADRVTGAYRAVLWGGVLIACGHYAMAAPFSASTWLGLGLIIAGTGLLKPNASTLVGGLYTTADQRRDAGFALYYTAINIGAFLGPLVAGWLGQREGWHWGFSAAAVGMTLGLVQYVLGRRHLPGHRKAARALPSPAARRTVRLLGGGLVLLAVVLAALSATGVLTTERFVDALTVVAVAAPVAYFAVMFKSPRTTPQERGRLRPYVVLFAASCVFNVVLFQSYSTITLLAAQHARTEIFGLHFPSTWYNSVLGVGEVVLAPVVAALWQRLGTRQPHASRKIAYGTVLGGLSFLVLVPATWDRSGDWQMAAWWLLVSFLLLGLGDILLETTGMSATTKLAPAAFSSQTMALWFLSMAAANGIQAQVVRYFGVIPDRLYFGLNGAAAVVAGLAVVAAGPWLRRRMHPVH
ncbi:peptide MFS transporter [Streptomyces sp. NPDC059740]|uniref:peptide MFS transporter n=1 Tax=Streptomyces sp. NPDC059740 TaxID=3346926 RepID=UPI00365A460C